MNVKIGILSHSEHFLSLATELSRELNEVEILVQKTTSEEAQKNTQHIESKGVEAILTRGEFSAETIKKVSKVPVVKCRFSMLDLTKNLEGINPNIDCLISGQMFFPATFDEICKEIEKIMGIKLRIFYYQNIEEMKQILKKAKTDKIDTVLGGYIINQEAKKIGQKSKELLFSKQTLQEYVHHAKKIVLENRKIKKESKWLKSAIEFNRQGIIAIDNKDNISDLNKQAQVLLSSTEDKLLNKSIYQYLPLLKPLIQKREPSQDNITQIQKQKIVFDFMPLYLQNEYIGAFISLEQAGNIQKLEQKIRKTMTDKGLAAKFTLEDVIGSSSLIRRTIKMAETFAKTEFNILISGETGTGKELFAQGVHLKSSRCNGPFVAINCAAVPQSLLESELFGYEDGAFTGAKKGGKLGLFELAHGGTIFLDEILEMPLNLQARLLRVLEEKEILRVGGDKIIPIDIRIITATNEILDNFVTNGGFRKDLYYRINELNLTIPPLKNRKEDIPELVRYFLKNYETTPKSIDPHTEDCIMDIIKNSFSDHHWPGNVRELSNLIKRCMALLETVDQPGELQTYFTANDSSETIKDVEVISVKKGTLAEMEKELISNMFKNNSYNKSELAKKLNISRSTLWRILNS